MFRRMRRRKREPWRVAEECGEMVVRVPSHGPKRVSIGARPYIIPRRGYPHGGWTFERKRGVILDSKRVPSRVQVAAHPIHPWWFHPSPPRFFFPHLSVPPLPLGVALIHGSGWGREGEDGSPERHEQGLGVLPLHGSREQTPFEGGGVPGNPTPLSDPFAIHPSRTIDEPCGLFRRSVGHTRSLPFERHDPSETRSRGCTESPTLSPQRSSKVSIETRSLHRFQAGTFVDADAFQPATGRRGEKRRRSRTGPGSGSSRENGTVNRMRGREPLRRPYVRMQCRGGTGHLSTRVRTIAG